MLALMITVALGSQSAKLNQAFVDVCAGTAKEMEFLVKASPTGIMTETENGTLVSFFDVVFEDPYSAIRFLRTALTDTRRTSLELPPGLLEWPQEIACVNRMRSNPYSPWGEQYDARLIDVPYELRYGDVALILLGCLTARSHAWFRSGEWILNSPVYVTWIEERVGKEIDRLTKNQWLWNLTQDILEPQYADRDINAFEVLIRVNRELAEKFLLQKIKVKRPWTPADPELLGHDDQVLDPRLYDKIHVEWMRARLLGKQLPPETKL